MLHSNLLRGSYVTFQFVEIISIRQVKGFVIVRARNIVGKGENADKKPFLLFPECFQTLSLSASLKMKLIKISKRQINQTALSFRTKNGNISSGGTCTFAIAIYNRVDSTDLRSEFRVHVLRGLIFIFTVYKSQYDINLHLNDKFKTHRISNYLQPTNQKCFFFLNNDCLKNG